MKFSIISFFFFLVAGSLFAGETLQLMAPEKQAYTGAYVDFGEKEDHVTRESIEAFERKVGKHQAIIASSSYWGKNSFPKKNIEIISNYGAVPLIYWSPWDKPYEQSSKPDRFHLKNILAGQYDAYIDMWAEGAKACHYPIMVAWGIEMNGTWFPWSGYFYGKGELDTNGHFTGPEVYKKTYRYIVDRVRKKGASNIIWVFHANNSSDPDEKWNTMKQYYPGDDYVNWLGLSAYGQQYPGQGWLTFNESFPDYYKKICAVTPNKPVILAEWGIGYFPKSGNRAAWIAEALWRFTTEFPRLKAAVFWHERWQNGDKKYSNLYVDASPACLKSYREGVSNLFWLGNPLFKSEKP